MAKHDYNTIIKFADDTTVVGLITDNDETAYREEVRDLDEWCQNNNLCLNVTKTKEMIVDYRKRSTEHAPILIDGAVVDQVESFNVKKARQNLIPRRRQTIWHGSPVSRRGPFGCISWLHPSLILSPTSGFTTVLNTW